MADDWSLFCCAAFNCRLKADYRNSGVRSESSYTETRREGGKGKTFLRDQQRLGHRRCSNI